MAREQASRTRQQIQVIQAEAVAPDTVVIERTSGEPRAGGRRAHDDRADGGTGHAAAGARAVRQEPTTVVVEQPQPARDVVIQRDPAVVVVPE